MSFHRSIAAAVVLAVSFSALAEIQSQRLSQQGVTVQMDAVVAGPGTATLTFRVLDEASGSPIDASRPRVWLSRRRSEAVATETSCLDKIRNFASGQLTARADADLNGYLVATLNDDRTVTFINPFVSGSSKLEAAVELKAPAADWVYSPQSGRVFISLPGASAIAAVDAVSLKLIQNIPLPTGLSPGRLTLAPEGDSLWIALDHSTKVAVLDTVTLKLRGYALAGNGEHHIGFSTRPNRAFITNRTDGTVTAVNPHTLASLATIPVVSAPSNVVWLSAARTLYIAGSTSTHIDVLDPEANRVVRRIPAQSGIASLQPAPDGRFLLALNPSHNMALLLDSSVAQIINAVPIDSAPDQAAFTGSYVYIHAAATNSFAVFNMNELKTAHPAALYVQTGDTKPRRDASLFPPGSMVVPLPENDGVLSANGPDAVLYFLEDGMAAPKGTLQNYRRKPIGVLIIDRGLRTLGAGVYSAKVRVPDSGRFDIPVVLEQPKVRLCFVASLTGSPLVAKPVGITLKVSPSITDEPDPIPGSPREFRFRIESVGTRQPIRGLRSLQLLAFEPPGQWQRREWLVDLGDGTYVATHTFPHPGSFVLQVTSAQTGFGLQSSPILLHVR